LSPELVAGIVVVASVGAWALFLGYLFVVKGSGVIEKEAPAETAEVLVSAGVQAEGAPSYVVELDVPEPKPRRIDDDAQGVTRRQFLNRAWVGSLMVGLVQFGAASIDFLWPRLRGGFGTKIVVGNVDAIRAEVEAARAPKFIPDGRFWIAFYQGNPEAAEKVPTYKKANVPETGVMALYRKCVHLGCSVPWCDSSQWFECPCHGSKYSVNGEYRDGPAPRSLDQFRVELIDGEIVVDTSAVILGAPRGTVTTQPQPEGENCVALG
jgi:cytochrome b6-f complex iron-sulfur subunit